MSSSSLPPIQYDHCIDRAIKTFPTAGEDRDWRFEMLFKTFLKEPVRPERIAIRIVSYIKDSDLRNSLLEQYSKIGPGTTTQTSKTAQSSFKPINLDWSDDIDTYYGRSYQEETKIRDEFSFTPWMSVSNMVTTKPIKSNSFEVSYNIKYLELLEMSEKDLGEIFQKKEEFEFLLSDLVKIRPKLEVQALVEEAIKTLEKQITSLTTESKNG